MNKKILLLGVLILGLLVIGAACSQSVTTVAPATTNVNEEESVVPEEGAKEEPEVLEGEITDENEGQAGSALVGEVNLNTDLVNNAPTINLGNDGTTNENIPVRAFNMVAKQFEFIPSVIRVKKGSRVVLNITSSDVEHGFAIDEYKINKTIPEKGTVTIDFIADKAGQFEFYCSVYCGSGHSNMRGKFIVE